MATCKRCSGYVHTVIPKQEGLCFDCWDMQKSDEYVDHSNMIRCPYCRHIASVDYFEDPDLYTEGECDVICDECEKGYSVAVSVSYSYESPAMKGGDDGPK